MGHDARVDLAGVGWHETEEMERPEQNADDSGQCGEGKEKAEWFAREERRERGGVLV